MRTAVALVVLVGCTGAEPEPTEGSLLALTYNVQGLPDALSDSPRPTADRMVDIAPLLDAYDVVGLQETFDEDWHALLTAEATHPIRAWTSDRRDDAVYSAGLGLLSRVGTDVGYDELFYSQCHGTLDGSGDCLATKGLQIQSLQLVHGDPCRGLPIPIYMIFPRLFTCPTVTVRTFKIQFEVNLIVQFCDGYQITENFPIQIYR